MKNERCNAFSDITGYAWCIHRRITGINHRLYTYNIRRFYQLLNITQRITIGPNTAGYKISISQELLLDVFFGFSPCFIFALLLLFFFFRGIFFQSHACTWSQRTLRPLFMMPFDSLYRLIYLYRRTRVTYDNVQGFRQQAVSRRRCMTGRYL